MQGHDQATFFSCAMGKAQANCEADLTAIHSLSFSFLLSLDHPLNPLSNTTMAVTTHEATSASGTESESAAHHVSNNSNNTSNNKKNTKTRRKKKKAAPATTNGSHVAKDEEENPKEVRRLRQRRNC
jgi:replication initiation and membrane attachment protein DnaB